MSDAARHWESVYETKPSDEVSWFQTVPTISVELIDRWASKRGSLVDIGSGASSLVDVLINAGWPDVTVLDISEQALKEVRARLGSHADRVSFVASDVCLWRPDRSYEVWHDRAVFHFLVQPSERDAYIALAARAVVSGGIIVIGTFAIDGPTQCSGLSTSRYDSEGIAKVFGSTFTLLHTEREDHVTPDGVVQRFLWSVLRRA